VEIAQILQQNLELSVLALALLSKLESFSYMDAHCCMFVFREPAICLICGDLLCYPQRLCGKQGNKNRICHAKNDSEESGDGIRIFFLLRSTQLVLIRGNREFMGLSIYLDHHGEEDLYLRRSQLLYLNDVRMNEVRRLWLTAGFDYDSYILHHSHIRAKKSFGYAQ
jgi:hypothetical protein